MEDREKQKQQNRKRKHLLGTAGFWSSIPASEPLEEAAMSSILAPLLVLLLLLLRGVGGEGGRRKLDAKGLRSFTATHYHNVEKRQQERKQRAR
jgi:hypothetical protein